jgi:hypothetical protein
MQSDRVPNQEFNAEMLESIVARTEEIYNKLNQIPIPELTVEERVILKQELLNLRVTARFVRTEATEVAEEAQRRTSLIYRIQNK